MNETGILQSILIPPLTQLNVPQAKYIKAPPDAIKDEDLTFFNNMLTSSASSPETVSHHPGKVLNIIPILDTGGQPEYIHLLPTINIHPTVTFVVFDLSKNLDVIKSW